MHVSVPCGVFVFLNKPVKTGKKSNKVSVPCGVFVFLNIEERLIKPELFTEVGFYQSNR